MLGGTCGWRYNIFLNSGTYIVVRIFGFTLTLGCVIQRGCPRLIKPITWNFKSYLPWIGQVKNKLVSDHHCIGVPIHINHPLMNKGFHVNLILSFNNNILGQVKFKIRYSVIWVIITLAEMSLVSARDTFPK